MDQGLLSERYIPRAIGPREERIEVSAVEAQGDDSRFALCNQPDKSLVAVVGTGCVSAFELLYNRHSPMVFALILRIVENQQVAEELTQEVFLRVWQRSSTYHADRGSVRNWILSIAHNLAIDDIRRQQARCRQVYYDPAGDRLAPEVVDNSPEPSEIVLNRIRREQISRMLADLPVSQREVIEMAYFGGMTQAEIADYQGEPLSTVKTRTRLGLQRLRSGLLARGMQPGAL
jgi:RNA polymerase sigma-70 factor (ECF subfamily)